MLLYAWELPHNEVWATALFCVAMATDWLDGRIARSRGTTSSLGSLLDPIADKVLVLSVLVMLIEDGIWPAWMVAAIVARELLVSGLRLAAIERGVVMAARDLGKLKTWVAGAGGGARRVRGGRAVERLDRLVGATRRTRTHLGLRPRLRTHRPARPAWGRMSAREEAFEHAGGRTWYRIAGELGSGRPALLALHGGPGSTHHYFGPLERLAADGLAVVLYDQVGCGRSEKRSEAEWSLELFLDELDALRAELGLDRVHLLGTSWGGMLALEHALRRPGTLASLILSSTLAHVGDWEQEARRLRNELPADVRAVLDRHEAAGTYDDPEYVGAMAAFDARHFHRGDPRPELERMKAEKSDAAYRAMVGPNEWTMTGALKGWDVRPRLGELDVPTLVVRGRYDLCTDRIAQTLVDGIRGAEHVVFEHSSHTPVLEETKRYLEVVGGFLDEAER